MGNDNFVEILTALKEKRAQSELEHTEFIKNIDSMIENAENIIKTNGIIIRQYPSKAIQTPPKIQTPNKKIKIEEIIEVLKKANKTLHINELCEKINDKKKTKTSKITISMVISHYIRKFKKKAEIKKLGNSNYSLKK